MEDADNEREARHRDADNEREARHRDADNEREAKRLAAKKVIDDAIEVVHAAAEGRRTDIGETGPTWPPSTGATTGPTLPSSTGATTGSTFRHRPARESRQLKARRFLQQAVVPQQLEE